MIDLQRNTYSLFRLLAKQKISPEAFQELYLWLNHILDSKHARQSNRLVPMGQSTVRKLLNSQPNAARLFKQWQPVFSQSKIITTHQCHLFLKELFSTLEYTSEFQTQPIESGITHSIRHHFSDIHSYRPPNKKRKEWNLIMTVRGQGEFNCVRQTLLTQPGDLLLFSPDGLYDYHRSERSRLWSHRWVFFLPDEDWRTLLRWPEVGPGTFLLRPPIAEIATLEGLFKQIQYYRYQNQPLEQRLAKNLLEQLLIRCYQLAPNPDTALIDSRIETAVAYIRQHYSQDITVAEIANIAGISSSRLAVLFKQQQGVSPLTYRDEIRMSTACDLLFNTRLPITTIAGQVGYSDPQYFSRSFKRCMKQSPRQYRRLRQGQ